MEEVKIKEKKSSSIKDFITIGIVLVLHYVIFIASAPLGMTGVGNIFVYPLCSLLWGTLFILLCKKVDKPVLIMIYPLILALIQFMNFWATGVIGLVAAVAVFAILQFMDSSKFSTIAIAYTTMITILYLGATVPVLLFKDMFFELMPQYADLYLQVYNALSGYLFFAGLAAAVVCAILGALLGRKLLKKHFEKSGIAI